MPEGDSIRRAADKVAPLLVGQRIVAARSRWAIVADELAGRTCTAVDAVGKHLLITLLPDLVRIHLGMPGRVYALGPTDEVRRSLGSIGLQLDTALGKVVIVKAPTVDRFPARERSVHPVLRALGPDLLGAEVDWDEILARAARSDCPTVAELLLDQRVACGIGNVVKNEILFQERVWPFRPSGEVPTDLLRALFVRGRDLLADSVRRGHRKSTPEEIGMHYHVYGRTGRGCLVCGTVIRAEVHGAGLPRITYWCPKCQPS
jgi:endonuclease-8